MSQAVRVRLNCDCSCSYRSEGCGERPRIGSDVTYQRNGGAWTERVTPCRPIAHNVSSNFLLEDFTAGSKSWLFRI